MAIRRTSEQLKTDRIIKKHLLIFGDEVLEEAVPKSRRRDGPLQDEMNRRVFKDTQLHFAQMYYGAYNYPNNNNKQRVYVNGKLQLDDEMNALWHVVKKQLPNATKEIIKNINAVLLQNFKKK